MKIEKNRQDEARQKVQALLQSAEEMRRQKRVAHSVGEFMRGRLDLLFNDEFATAVPDYLSDTADEDAIESGLQLLQRLGEATIGHDQELRQRAVMILSLSANRIVDTENLETICALAEVLTSWLILEVEFVPGYEVLCRQLQDICLLLLNEGRLQPAEAILAAMHDIQSGVVLKKNSIRSVAKRSIDQVGQMEVIARLFDRLLQYQGDKQRQIERLLTLLGDPAVLHALALLEEREDEGDRRQLFHFLISAGRTAMRVFRDQMEQEASWSLRCDMLQILCAMKDDGVYPLIELNVIYPDARVQREAVDCIIRLGGENLISRLIEALFQVDDSLKNLIVKKLGKLENLAIRDALLTLLDEKVGRKDFTDELLLSSIVVALRPYPDTRALIQLRELREYVEGRESSKKLLHLIDDTLLTLESEMRHRRHRKIEAENIAYSDDPEATRQAKKRIQEIEKEVISLLEQGLGELAAEKLYQHCVAAAREKDFVTAERLRDRILGADTTSINLVVEADEIINWERESKIPASFYKLWKPLRSAIGHREFEALYGALVAEEYQDDEIIAREGERDDRLYFLNSGSVSLVCSTGNAKTFLKRLQPGAVIGADQFFAISVWTVTARARTPVGLHSLRRGELEKLEKMYPGISQKLEEYSSSGSVPELLKMSGGDRRSSPRYPVAAIIKTVLVDAYGETGHRSFVGQLQDISQGGFCYSIGIASRDNARLLLGRQVRFELNLEQDVLVRVEGVVVGIEPMENRKEMYNVHVKMIETLSPQEVRKIVDKLG